jgi:arginine/ornithine transport system ATP-binding protein
MTDQALKLQALDIHKRFGGNEVLKGVSLQARAGDVISIIGSSGSGKSTFLRCINLLEKPKQGRIIVAGEELRLVPARTASCRPPRPRSCSACARGWPWCSSISTCGPT